MLTTSAPVLEAPVTRPSPRGTRLRRGLVPYGYLTPTVVLMVVLMLIPIVMVISYSVMDNVILKKSPKFVGLDNYASILTNPTFATAVRNTLFFTLVSVAAHLVLGLTFALLLNTRLLSTRVKAFFRVLYVMPWLFTVAIIAILWRLLLSPNGIVNYVLATTGLTGGQVEWLSTPDTALVAVTFINIWSGYPFFMISLLAGLQGIPRELNEAARVDGASVVKQFLFITLPQLRPIIISMAMLDFIWTTQQFALIWMTTGGGPINRTEMLSTFTYKLAFSRYQFALASTSAVIILVLSMIIAFFYVRHQKALE